MRKKLKGQTFNSSYLKAPLCYVNPRAFTESQVIQNSVFSLEPIPRGGIMYCLPTGSELQLQYVLFSEPVSRCDAVAAFQADWTLDLSEALHVP